SFFFSSRRRHTRSLRDWSSDVCSSDLIAGRSFTLKLPSIILRSEIEAGLMDGSFSVKDLPAIWADKVRLYLGLDVPTDTLGVLRSEERRVGKECRARR